MPYTRGVSYRDASGAIAGRKLSSGDDAALHEGTAAGGPRGAPRPPLDLGRGAAQLLERRFWTTGRDGTVAGPVTRRRVNPATHDWPHRCVVCGRRDHAGIDCYRVAT